MHVEGDGVEQLVGVALRRNPRRAHLLVSLVLGKHVGTFTYQHYLRPLKPQKGNNQLKRTKVDSQPAKTGRAKRDPGLRTRF